jgi:hypothetical protein
MFGKRLCLAVLTVATVLSISAVAQDEKNEVGGLLGRTFVSDHSVSAEGLLVYNWDIDLNAGQYGNSVVPSDLKKLFVTPAARVNLLPTTAVSPWISFGAGFGHISENNQLIYGAPIRASPRQVRSLRPDLGLM